jgi:hypothetical protein
MRVHLLVVLAAGVLSTPVVLKERRGRGLLDFLEGDMAPEPTMVVTAGPGPETPPVVGEYPVGGTTTATEEVVTTVQHHQGTKTGEGITSHRTGTALIATASPSIFAAALDDTETRHAQGENGRGTSISIPGPTNSATLVAATNKDVSATPPGELAQWKVIGISIICVTFVAIIIMAVTFFDTWSAFVRDVAGCGGCRKGRDKGMRSGMENLSPDWDRRTWEFKLASEDGHRYPTLTSMDSMTKV